MPTIEQIKFGKGYDHNWVLNKGARRPDQGRRGQRAQERARHGSLDHRAGLQFYTGNFLDGTLKGKGKTYPHRGAFCMETQHYPGFAQQAAFPTTELKPGATYHTTTLYRFSAK